MFPLSGSINNAGDDVNIPPVVPSIVAGRSSPLSQTVESGYEKVALSCGCSVMVGVLVNCSEHSTPGLLTQLASVMLFVVPSKALAVDSETLVPEPSSN